MGHSINPIVPKIKSYTRDSTYITNLLNDINYLPQNTLMHTLHVGSLHTKILHSEGIQAISGLVTIHRNPSDLSQNHYMTELLRIVLAFPHNSLQLGSPQTSRKDLLSPRDTRDR